MFWNKATEKELREIKYVLAYTGIYPDESWTTASKAVMRALKKMNFNVTANGNRWSLRRA